MLTDIVNEDENLTKFSEELERLINDHFGSAINKK